MTIRIILFTALSIVFSTSCIKKKPIEKMTPTVEEKPLAEFIVLSDSLNSSWKTMIDSDDKKLLLVKRLIEEISYTPQPDPIKIEQLKAFQLNVKTRRYTQLNLTEPDKIDFYDRSTDTLMRSVYQLAAATPNIDRYPLVNELVGDINALDNQVVIHRAGYDRWVKLYNAYLVKNLDNVKAVYPDSIAIKPLGLFELEQ